MQNNHGLVGEIKIISSDLENKIVRYRFSFIGSVGSRQTFNFTNFMYIFTNLYISSRAYLS